VRENSKHTICICRACSLGQPRRRPYADWLEPVPTELKKQKKKKKKKKKEKKKKKNGRVYMYAVIDAGGSSIVLPRATGSARNAELYLELLLSKRVDGILL